MMTFAISSKKFWADFLDKIWCLVSDLHNSKLNNLIYCRKRTENSKILTKPNRKGIYIKYYTSNSNCPIRKLSLCHVSMKLIAISRLTSSISEPAFLLTMFHPMFPGEHGVEHYSRRPRETTRMTTTWPTKYK
jgi:hypothetical protein